MPTGARHLLDDELEDAIAAHVRIRAGRFPGAQLLDLSSRDGFLGAAIAEAAEEWTVHTATVPEDAPGNLEHAALDLPHLPFEDNALAGVVAAVVDEPLSAWSPELLQEVRRVLAPQGRFVVAFRAPGPRAPDIEPGIPDGAADELEAVGFSPVTETTEQPLKDGSQLRLIRAVVPEE